MPPDQVTQAPASASPAPTPPLAEVAEPHYSAVKLPKSVVTHLRPIARKSASGMIQLANPVSLRHGNPDLMPPRRAAWVYTNQLMAGSQTNYTANSLLPHELSAKRNVPKGVVYALVGSVLPYGAFLLAPLAPWIWVLSLTLPLASMLLAAGSLAKIKRNKTQFRGRGWAALALILATGYVGMVLFSLAALATSGVLWE